MFKGMDIDWCLEKMSLILKKDVLTFVNSKNSSIFIIQNNLNQCHSLKFIYFVIKTNPSPSLETFVEYNVLLCPNTIPRCSTQELLGRTKAIESSKLKSSFDRLWTTCFLHCSNLKELIFLSMKRVITFLMSK